MTSRLSEHPPRDFRMWILITSTVVMLANAAVIGWAFYLGSQIPGVEIVNMQKPTVTDVCPGQTLDYSFTLAVSKPGIIQLVTSVQRINPPDRATDARFQEFIFKEPTNFAVGRHWVVPPFYHDPSKDLQVPWIPGDYIQRTIASAAGRSLGESIIEVPFSIREGC